MKVKRSYSYVLNNISLCELLKIDGIVTLGKKEKRDCGRAENIFGKELGIIGKKAVL